MKNKNYDTMHSQLEKLISKIEISRNAFINSISGLTEKQTKFKPSKNEWSILEITEHIVWAEQIGICGMFNAINGIKCKKPIWEGRSSNKGMSIEQIVEKTWQSKEKAPKEDPKEQDPKKEKSEEPAPEKELPKPEAPKKKEPKESDPFAPDAADQDDPFK